MRTRDAARNGGDKNEQNRAVQSLESKYPGIVKVERNSTHHDRWIEVERPDGSKSRMIIGRGLDFIGEDGTVEPTYIVVQHEVRE